MTKFKNALKELREVLRWSVSDTARKLDTCGLSIADDTWRNWESGKTLPNVEEITVIAGLFGVGVERFFE